MRSNLNLRFENIRHDYSETDNFSAEMSKIGRKILCEIKYIFIFQTPTRASGVSDWWVANLRDNIESDCLQRSLQECVTSSAIFDLVLRYTGSWTQSNRTLFAQFPPNKPLNKNKKKISRQNRQMLQNRL